MTADRSPRFLVTTEPRPLRLAVEFDAPVSRQGYRRALRALTGTWGGVRSAVVTSGGDVPGAKSIDERWIPTVRALDPDVVYVPRRLAGLRAREDVGRSLDRVRSTCQPLHTEARLACGAPPRRE
jgi:hypothetical protein